MGKELLQQWLNNYKLKLPSNAPVVQNGDLLHLTNYIGDYKEWAAVTYNLNVLANMMMENKKLHKKLDELVDRYVDHLETLAKIKPPAPVNPNFVPFPPAWPAQSPGYAPPYMYPEYPINSAAQYPSGQYPANLIPGSNAAQYPAVQYPTTPNPANQSPEDISALANPGYPNWITRDLQKDRKEDKKEDDDEW